MTFEELLEMSIALMQGQIDFMDMMYVVKDGDPCWQIRAFLERGQLRGVADGIGDTKEEAMFLLFLELVSAHIRWD